MGKDLVLRDKYLGKELADELTAPTPEECIRTRPIRGGGTVRYVSGSHFIEKLNNCFGFLWSYNVPEQFEKDGQLVSKGQLTVHIPVPKRQITREYEKDGRTVREATTEYERWDIVKTQFGSSEIKRYAKDETDRKTGKLKHRVGDVIDLADDYKAAGTDAMKKCATQLGIFLDVYGPREEEGEGVTKIQLEVLYMRGQEAGMSEEETKKWAEKELGKLLGECDVLEVMGLIPKLMDKANEG